MPRVPTEIRDEKRNITIRILAYRKLTEEEVLQAVAILFSGKRRPKKNTRYEITSSHGLIEGA